MVLTSALASGGCAGFGVYVDCMESLVLETKANARRGISEQTDAYRGT
jgi:hypothetical protein